ncbi:MFS transporter [Bradyrhizobium sp. U87765 SZCCT0131]|uniref:MFS transporter n=1 Tax=unclassified Bradyrhizobium TaxID=2631580 RepID=UPI001BA7C53D|nr:MULTISPECIES: MFS transporter [unclassified Bradyrhizobium]MBR1217061.1 MFS transporter [Bradyrhizobium sp. U87765 SZCCT0131]MBR1259183.1 MFS transporter [Bradyrhizobium sp. U87765 SZCCT0134]MBR1305324.1 MFS transporter [Bradyrhizobium sp. U87765 SZCCT0110]MBR1321110.1 MFS transporter [Bradyrhizobium sp. U87765 SZCCT0109]MBR1350236.1 MFS transporter [Bradyrhizobium sp. U87765 SZCCT0048]
MSFVERGDGDALVRRVMWRIMPLLVGMMLLAVIDRSNVGYAKLQMVHSLGISETTYGLASSLFFIGYSLFEVPSALAAHKFGARLWFARILITWGVLTVALGFTFSGSLFAAVRFLVGVAEAGAYPGIIFYLTLWFPRRYRVQAVALLTIGSPLGNMFGSLFGGTLLDLDGFLGLAGWQWVFVVTGAPAVILFVLILKYLPDGPQTANFLSTDEKSWLTQELGRDDAAEPMHSHPLRVLIDPRVWWFAFVYTMITLALYGIIYWLPTVVKGFGATGTQNGLLTALPWAVAAAVLMWLPRHLREHRTVLIGMGLIALCGMAAFFTSTLLEQNWMRYVALAVGTPCISLLFPCFWYLPSQIFRGAHAAAAIAAISTIGSLGGFAAQNLMPWVAYWSGSALAAMAVPAASLAVLALSAALMLAIWRVASPADFTLTAAPDTRHSQVKRSQVLS